MTAAHAFMSRVSTIASRSLVEEASSRRAVFGTFPETAAGMMGPSWRRCSIQPWTRAYHPGGAPAWVKEMRPGVPRILPDGVKPESRGHRAA